MTEKCRNDCKILMPSYICESVQNIFPKEKIVFYDLQESFEVEEQLLVSQIESGDFDESIFYLMNYFGGLTSQRILKNLRTLCWEHRITVVEDTTHSIFTKPSTIGDYCIASLRKWMAVPEGAVIYSKNQLPEEWGKLEHAQASHKIEAMVLKNLFLGHTGAYLDLKDLDLINRNYRYIFTNEEEQIESRDKLYGISDVSSFLLACGDVNQIIAKRKKNYYFLKEMLQDSGIELYPCANMQELDGVPFVALLLSDNGQRDLLKHNLSEHKIYCAVHWSIKDKAQLDHVNVQKWTEQLISLPIDQRYGIEEMEYLAETIISCFRR
ncbi:MAG: hypothetical protein NC313_04515 [Butyrivibrio sp.]|nr:hypothetical protein [Butyrivibrio sp.]